MGWAVEKGWKPVCAILWVLRKTDKAVIKPLIKPVHEIRKTDKTGLNIK